MKSGCFFEQKMHVRSQGKIACPVHLIAKPFNSARFAAANDELDWVQPRNAMMPSERERERERVQKRKNEQNCQ